MSDEVDIGNDMVERTIAMALVLNHVNANIPEAQYTGFCLNCGDKTGANQRWCDVSCRNDHQARKGRQYGG